MTYIKLFLDYLDAIEPLGDAERGRLFTSLLEYGRTGEAPQLGGNERFIFPMMRAQIDRDRLTFESESEHKKAVRSEAGKKGAEARWIANDGKNGECHNDMAKMANDSKRWQTMAKMAKDKEEDKDKDKEEDVKKESKKKKAAAFVPPTLEEVKAYCAERGNKVDAERFYDYYTSNGWQVGKNKMKDWKAAVRTWEKNSYAELENKTSSKGQIVSRELKATSEDIENMQRMLRRMKEENKCLITLS